MATQNVLLFKAEIHAVANTPSTDLAARPMPYLWAWGIPFIIILLMSFLGQVIPHVALTLVLSTALLWMGLACVINAQRCRRRHCYYSGPIFILGALIILFSGFAISVGIDHMVIAGVALALSMLTYATEPIFGKYIE